MGYLALFLTKLVPAADSFSTLLRESIAITNNKGDKESPWNVPLLMDTSPRSLPHAVSCVFQDSMLSLISPLMLSAAPTRSSVSNIKEWGVESYAFL